MAVNSKYKFYIADSNESGDTSGDVYDLEVDFEGLKYISCEGIDKYGKAKNIYTETYSDADRSRVYLPTQVKRESTQITLNLIFVGDNRRFTYNAFCQYISKGLKKYWDTARNRYFVFYTDAEFDTSEESWHSGTPYIKASFKLNNIYGETKKL